MAESRRVLTQINIIASDLRGRWISIAEWACRFRVRSKIERVKFFRAGSEPKPVLA
jgi:hypothetical protein